MPGTWLTVLAGLCLGRRGCLSVEGHLGTPALMALVDDYFPEDLDLPDPAWFVPYLQPLCLFLACEWHVGGRGHANTVTTAINSRLGVVWGAWMPVQPS
jgi:hypothetical protein